MSRKKPAKEWDFFRKPNGHISYCDKCLGCTKEYKQSYRAEIVYCPNYEKRSCKTGE